MPHYMGHVTMLSEDAEERRRGWSWTRVGRIKAWGPLTAPRKTMAGLGPWPEEDEDEEEEELAQGCAACAGTCGRCGSVHRRDVSSSTTTTPPPPPERYMHSRGLRVAAFEGASVGSFVGALGSCVGFRCIGHIRRL